MPFRCLLIHIAPPRRWGEIDKGKFITKKVPKALCRAQCLLPQICLLSFCLLCFGSYHHIPVSFFPSIICLSVCLSIIFIFFHCPLPLVLFCRRLPVVMGLSLPFYLDEAPLVSKDYRWKPPRHQHTDLFFVQLHVLSISESMWVLRIINKNRFNVPV